VRAIRPSGEGSLKKSFELLRAKLEKEGLFAAERKRMLPVQPHHIAVISSIHAAGYADFIKIVGDRWGGLQIDVGQVQVQGADAPDQIIRALRYFNSQEEVPEVIVIIRGGGSADDLGAFNDELLVREVATSRVPTLVGVGHEVDVSLADLAADVRAATPSNAAQILVPDRYEVIRTVQRQVRSLLPRIEHAIDTVRSDNRVRLERAMSTIEQQFEQRSYQLSMVRRVLGELDPHRVLERGYALIRGDIIVGATIEVEKNDMYIKAEVTHVDKK
jgi:exodeoxyribonuclease VII large subunit